ncbi:MAG: starch-binding protein [Bacteroides sp.]|nr:starch-binding protein [Bacteroides sp.]
MNKRFLLYLFTLLTNFALFGQGSVGMYYWLDTDYDARKFAPVADGYAEAEFSLLGLDAGFHLVNVQSVDDAGQRGSIFQYIFTSTETNLIKGFHYWIDSEFDDRVFQELNGEAEGAFMFDMTGASRGMHLLSIQSEDINGNRGPVYEYVFNCTDTNVQRGFYYWLDADFDNRKFKEVGGNTLSEVDFNLDGLDNGFHTVNLQSEDIYGNRGPVYQYYFASTDTQVLKNISYWFDNDPSTLKEIPVQSTFAVSADDLTPGVHRLSIRGITNTGETGPVSEFVVINTIPEHLDVAGYSYSINDVKGDVMLETPSNALEQTFMIPFPEVDKLYDLDRIDELASESTPSGEFTPRTVFFDNSSSGWDSVYCHYWNIGVGSQSQWPGDRMTLLSGASDIWMFEVPEEATGLVFNNGNGMSQTEDLEFAEGHIYDINGDSGVYDRYVSTSIPAIELEFTESDVKMKVNVVAEVNMHFFNRYKQSFGNIGEVFELEDNLTRTLHPLEMFGNVDLADCKGNSFEAAKFTHNTQAEGWLRFSRPCRYRLYRNGEEISKGQIEAAGDCLPIEKSDETYQVLVYGAEESPEAMRLHLLSARNSAPAPVIVRTANEVTISCADPDATIRYTLDGSEPTEESPVYTAALSLTKNVELVAAAFKEELDRSATASLSVIDLQVILPRINFVEGKVAFECDTPDAEIFYAIGESAAWIPYSGGDIELSDNKIIRCYATSGSLNDSEVARFTPEYFRVAPAAASYNGRYLTLSTSTPDAIIRYAFDEDEVTLDSPQYNSAIQLDAEGTGTLRMLVYAPYLLSEYSDFDIKYYFDGERATLAEAGLLEASMEWMTEADKGAVRELTLTGAASVEDFPAICTLGSLETIDMTDLTVAPGTMTGVATDGLKKLRYAILPKEATSIVGAQALVSACPNICAVKWTAPMAVPANFSESFQNKNLLIYLDARAYAPASMPNVIVAGQATDGIILTDGYPFYCPEAFTANRAEITRDFSMTSGMGEAQGWETIALPFSADRFEHESAGSIAPFAAATGEDTPFWLYGLSSGGWEAASEIEANTPYIISMPNNEAYADRFNLNGKVRIYAENVEVPVTQNGESTYGSRHFRTSMMPMEASTALYNLNDATLTGGYRPGSVFIPGLRDVRPLEAYMTTNSPERAIRIFNDFTHVDLLPVFGDDGLTVRSLNGAIIISSMTERDVRVMDAAGAVVASPRLMPGEETRIDTLPHGVYFVGGIKVII